MSNVPNLSFKPTYTDIREIVKDPEKWALVQSFIDEAVKVRQLISHEKENLKALREACHDAAKLHPKVFNCIVDAVYNNDYVQRLDTMEQQQAMLELMMEDTNFPPVESVEPKEGDDEPKLRAVA